MQNTKNVRLKKLIRGFTLVELIVVIAVIGILATISVVGYGNWMADTTVTQVKNDLNGAAAAMENSRTFNNTYPTTVPPTFISKSGSTITGGSTDGKSFCVAASNNNIIYHIANGGTPLLGDCPAAALNPADWLVIGTQTWGKYNLNVGVRVGGVTVPTNNSILEKYCYNDIESNCTTYGGLYPWNEAMQYVTTNASQGICPAGSHLPSDNDWKILEIQLGMVQAQVDAINWRGTDQGTQLQPIGTSGLNMLPAGIRNNVGYFSSVSFDTGFWTSSESGTSAWWRYLGLGFPTVNRNTVNKDTSLSVRCLGN